MRSFVLATIGALALGAPLRAQDTIQNYAGVTSYVFSIPTGDTRRLLTTPSWLAVSWEGVWAVGRTTAAGVAFSVQNFRHESSGTTTYPWGAATGQTRRSLLVTSAMATSRWYPLAQRTRRLHVGLQGGVLYSEETYELGVSRIVRGATHLALAPGAGWQFPIVNHVDGLVSAYYTIPATRGDYVGGARRYPFASLSIGVLER